MRCLVIGHGVRALELCHAFFKKLIYSHNNRIQLTARETGNIGFLKILQDVPLRQAYSQVRH